MRDQALDDRDADVAFKRLLFAISSQNVNDIENILHQNESFKGNKRSKALFMKAVTTNNHDVIRCLLRHGVVPEDESPIFGAISQVDALKLVLAQKYSVDVVSSTGKRPLHVAILTNPEALPILLRAGCDVTSRDTVHGNTPLHVACALCNEEAVLLLIQAGAWLNPENKRGETPLYSLLKHASGANQSFHSKSRQNLAKSLITLGMTLPPCARKSATSNYKVVQVYEHLLRTSRQVASLQHLCRVAVRGHCELAAKVRGHCDVAAKVRGHNMANVLTGLDISSFLKDYLLYRPCVFDRTV